MDIFFSFLYNFFEVGGGVAKSSPKLGVENTLNNDELGRGLTIPVDLFVLYQCLRELVSTVLQEFRKRANTGPPQRRHYRDDARAPIPPGSQESCGNLGLHLQGLRERFFRSKERFRRCPASTESGGTQAQQKIDLARTGATQNPTVLSSVLRGLTWRSEWISREFQSDFRVSFKILNFFASATFNPPYIPKYQLYHSLASHSQTQPFLTLEFWSTKWKSDRVDGR